MYTLYEIVRSEIHFHLFGCFQVIEDPDLRERHLGDLQGLVLREAAEFSPAAYKAFVCRNTSQDIPVS